MRHENRSGFYTRNEVVQSFSQDRLKREQEDVRKLLREDKLKASQEAAVLFDAEVTYVPALGPAVTFVRDGMVLPHVRNPKRQSPTGQK